MRHDYPWDEWLDGGPRLFTQADDFPGRHVDSFVDSARREARRRGLALRWYRIGEGHELLAKYGGEPPALALWAVAAA